MLNIEELREELSDRALHVVAERAGISRKTLYNIMSGNSANYSTIEKLSDYIENRPSIRNKNEALVDIDLKALQDKYKYGEIYFDGKPVEFHKCNPWDCLEKVYQALRHERIYSLLLFATSILVEWSRGLVTITMSKNLPDIVRYRMEEEIFIGNINIIFYFSEETCQETI